MEKYRKNQKRKNIIISNKLDDTLFLNDNTQKKKFKIIEIKNITKETKLKDVNYFNKKHFIYLSNNLKYKRISRFHSKNKINVLFFFILFFVCLPKEIYVLRVLNSMNEIKF